MIIGAIKKLTDNAIESLSSEQVARAYCLLLKLRTFGFSVSKELIISLSTEPDESDADASEWWEKAQQVLGVVTISH